MRKEIATTGIVFALFTEAASGCGIFGKNEKPVIPLSKQTVSVGLDPLSLPSPAPRFLREDNALQTGKLEGDRMWILYSSSLPEHALDMFEAEVELRQLFTSDFLTTENLGRNLELEPVSSLGVQPGKSSRMRQWKTKDKPNSKLSATVAATFGIMGLETITITGQVRGILPWEENYAIVKSGEAEKVVTALEQYFALTRRKETLLYAPGRHLSGSNELIDLVNGVSGEEEISGGRATFLMVYPNGEFRYSMRPRDPK